jgi:iron complex transport system ATP-binding protein
MIDFWGHVTRTEKAQALNLLRQVQCEDLAGRPWRVLSQGERQRVLIARALMAKPRVLILDEPCAGLDPAAREHFLQFIQRFGARTNSSALVLVTHHVEEIMPVFSHLLVLKNGKVLAAGKKSDVLNSRNLSNAFNARMQLQRIKNRYVLNVTMKSRAMM